MPDIPYFFSHIFPWPFVAFGAYLAFTAARQVIRAAGSPRWPTVEGKVVKSTLEMTDSGGDYPVDLFSPNIEYKYSVAGVSNTSRRVALADINPGSRAKAETIIKQYRPGMTVRVYVSPQDPDVTILMPGLRWPLAGKLLFGLVMLGAGVAMLVVLGGLSLLNIRR